jgi:hypothetical protein
VYLIGLVVDGGIGMSDTGITSTGVLRRYLTSTRVHRQYLITNNRLGSEWSNFVPVLPAIHFNCLPLSFYPIESPPAADKHFPRMGSND